MLFEKIVDLYKPLTTCSSMPWLSWMTLRRRKQRNIVMYPSRYFLFIAEYTTKLIELLTRIRVDRMSLKMRGSFEAFIPTSDTTGRIANGQQRIKNNILIVSNSLVSSLSAFDFLCCNWVVTVAAFLPFQSQTTMMTLLTMTIGNGKKSKKSMPIDMKMAFWFDRLSRCPFLFPAVPMCVVLLFSALI